jgi:pilus assembly protein Flp/PilA
LGQTQQVERLSNAAGGRPAGRLAARFDLSRPTLAEFWLAEFWADERGATAIEYGLIGAMVFLVIITSVSAFGNKASNVMVKATTAISTAIG